MTTYNLDETSFPLYGIQAINASMFVVAGGGGSAKTGVKNAIVCILFICFFSYLWSKIG